jgi:hypothetical protein
MAFAQPACQPTGASRVVVVGAGRAVVRHAEVVTNLPGRRSAQLRKDALHAAISADAHLVRHDLARLVGPEDVRGQPGREVAADRADVRQPSLLRST